METSAVYSSLLSRYILLVILINIITIVWFYWRPQIMAKWKGTNEYDNIRKSSACIMHFIAAVCLF
jgi:hypothetical protein